VPEGAECSPSIGIAFGAWNHAHPHERQLTQPEPAPLAVAATPAQRLLRRVSTQTGANKILLCSLPFYYISLTLLRDKRIVIRGNPQADHDRGEPTVVGDIVNGSFEDGQR
jgi:hypothetical protein